MSLPSLESAERSLLRHIRQGRSLRTKNAANCAKNLALEALRSAATARLCRAYRVTPGELATAYLEILAAMPDPIVPGSRLQLAPTLLIVDPERLDLFLQDVRRSTLGLTAHQRRLALVECSRRQGRALNAPTPSVKITHSFLIKSSIQSKLPLLLLCGAILIAAIALAAYFLPG